MPYHLSRIFSARRSCITRPGLSSPSLALFNALDSIDIKFVKIQVHGFEMGSALFYHPDLICIFASTINLIHHIESQTWLPNFYTFFLGLFNAYTYRLNSRKYCQKGKCSDLYSETLRYCSKSISVKKIRVFVPKYFCLEVLFGCLRSEGSINYAETNILRSV